VNHVPTIIFDQAANEAVFADMCEKLFGNGPSRYTGEAAAPKAPTPRMHAQLEKSSIKTSHDQSPPSASETKASLGHSQDPVLWAMANMQLDSDHHTGDCKQPDDTKSHHPSSEHFPVPSGRPVRPPTTSRPLMKVAGGSGHISTGNLIFDISFFTV
jgi:hypothetical protein